MPALGSRAIRVAGSRRERESMPPREGHLPAGASGPARLAAASLLILVLAGACAGEHKAWESRPSHYDAAAADLYERSVQELANGEHVPALVDIYRAEKLAREKDLRAMVARQKAFILNRLQVFTTVEGPATLKYTLVYSEEEVYRPMAGLEVRFVFIEGQGIISASGATDLNGTSSGVIEKITSLGRKVVVEAAPAVRFDEGPVAIDELKREFVLSRRHAAGDQDPEKKGAVLDIIHDILQEIFYWTVID
jgi:hypothetical protein